MKKFPRAEYGTTRALNSQNNSLCGLRRSVSQRQCNAISHPTRSSSRRTSTRLLESEGIEAPGTWTAPYGCPHARCSGVNAMGPLRLDPQNATLLPVLRGPSPLEPRPHPVRKLTKPWSPRVAGSHQAPGVRVQIPREPLQCAAGQGRAIQSRASCLNS